MNKNVDRNVVKFLEQLVPVTVEEHKQKAIDALAAYKQFGNITSGRRKWATKAAKVNKIEVPEAWADVPAPHYEEEAEQPVQRPDISNAIRALSQAKPAVASSCKQAIQIDNVPANSPQLTRIEEELTRLRKLVETLIQTQMDR